MIVTGEQNMPIVKVTRNFQVTIPLEVREQLGIEKGDILEAVVQEKAVLFKPKVLFDRESVEAYIAEGLEEARTGKTVEPFESMEEYDKHVKRTS
jgi:AbrB family looped-hinge helix DNA binding protein